MNDLLRAGIAAAKSGQRERARDLLMRVVEQDKGNVLAWLWLSGVVDSLDDREICLENVLTLDPDNDAAREGLAWVRKQKGTRVPSSAETSPESSAAARAARPATLAAAILQEDFARRRPPPEPEPEPPPTTPLRDEFDNPYLCPYCAAQTDPDDRKCQACGHWCLYTWVCPAASHQRLPAPSSKQCRASIFSSLPCTSCSLRECLSGCTCAGSQFSSCS